MKNLTGKCVLLGITGGIAAYKMANVASALHKAGAKVHVIMTENATKFITPLTFETLTNSKCMVDTFDREFEFDVRHISVAKEALLQRTSLPRWPTASPTICSRLSFLPLSAKSLWRLP